MSAITAPDLALGLFMAFGACMSVGLSLWLEGNGTAARWRAKLAERKKPSVAERGDFPAVTPRPSQAEVDRVKRNFTVLLLGYGLMAATFWGFRPLLLHLGASERLMALTLMLLLLFGAGMTFWALAGSDVSDSRWGRLSFAVTLSALILLIIVLARFFGAYIVATMVAGGLGAIFMLRRSSSVERG